MDLGLSSRYATCNLGANSPEDLGDYFAWGELEPKSKYDTVNYLYSVEDNYKYGQEGDCPKLDPTIKKVLDLQDDVANLRMGGSWRIPSLEDIAELHNRCSWKWTTLKGVRGYLIKSMVEGYSDQSIFLPAAGFVLHGETVNVEKAGYYWTSALYNQNALHAIATVFDRQILIKYLPNPRYAGLTIRPVCDTG